MLFVDSTDPHSHCASFRLCGLWNAAKDRRKRSVLAWKDQIGQRKDKPLPGGNCKDLNISHLFATLFTECVQESIGNTARLWRAQVSSGNIREKYRGVMTLLEKLKLLVNDVRLMIFFM